VDHSEEHALPSAGFFSYVPANRWLLALFPFTTPKDIVIRSCFLRHRLRPIASISLSTFQWVPLHVSGPLIVLPAILAAALLCLLHPAYAPRVCEGLAPGSSPSRSTT